MELLLLDDKVMNFYLLYLYLHIWSDNFRSMDALYLDKIFPAKSPRQEFCCYKKEAGRVETTEYVIWLQIINSLAGKTGPSASLLLSLSLVSRVWLLKYHTFM